MYNIVLFSSVELLFINNSGPLSLIFTYSLPIIHNIYVYTAGTQQYADAVLGLILKNHVISKRFYRKSRITYNRKIIKYLTIIRK
jgi:TFIIF-interacting CTD phosphatase-like protein